MARLSHEEMNHPADVETSWKGGGLCYPRRVCRWATTNRLEVL